MHVCMYVHGYVHMYVTSEWICSRYQSVINDNNELVDLMNDILSDSNKKTKTSF
jgi:hypothetical protein